MVGTVFQLKVTLRGTRPAVWRRIRVPGGITLEELHDALQIALGWTNSHLHQFFVGSTCFGMVDGEDVDPNTQDERLVRLDDIARAKSTLEYEYDFGDGWEHDVLVERVDDAIGVVEPMCMDGRRACPPEDCGGPLGFADLVKILANIRHPDHEEMIGWAGANWRADIFDIDGTNKLLRALGARWKRRPARRRPTASGSPRPAND